MPKETPAIFGRIKKRWRAPLRRGDPEHELDDELRFHLERENVQNLKADAQDARHAALKSLGRLEQSQKERRDSRNVRLVEQLWQDSRYAVRLLIRSPGFTAATLVILAVGIGSIGTIFSVVNGVVLKPLPYSEPNRLVRIYGAWPQGSREGISPPDFFDYRSQVSSLDAVAAESTFASVLSLSGGEQPVQLNVRMVSAGFFHSLGITPLVGREFRTDEEIWEGPNLAMLNYDLWTKRFGGDSSIVGKQITLNEKAHTVVGVLPPFFDLAGSADVYLPQQQKIEAMRKIRSQTVIGRLKPGVEIQQVQNELNLISLRLAETYPDVNKSWRTFVLSLHEEVVRNVRLVMFMLLVAVVLVVLIVVTNLANLILAKVAGQQNEIAVRVALGASRFRVAQQLLTFTTIMALLGGLLGIGLAYFVIALVKRLGPASIPRLSTIAIDFSVLTFMLLVSIVIGVFLAIVPMTWIRHMAVSDSLKQGTRVLGSRLCKLQTGFIVAEIALTMVLAVAAGLLIHSMVQLQQVDPGFKADHLLTTRIAIPANKYTPREKLSAFWRELIEKLETVPGVESAAAASTLPLSGFGNVTPFKAVTADKKEYLFSSNNVSANYLPSMRVPLLAGRHFSSSDREGKPVVILINEVFKHDVFGADDPIGKELEFPVNTFKKATVVGVVGNVHQSSLAAEPAREVYMSLEQVPVLTYSLVVRTKQDPAAITKAIQQTVWSMDPNQGMASFVTMDEVIELSLTQERFRTFAFVSFSFVALILSAIGLYGVLSYVVTQRSREIGVRMALGAKQQDILKLILGRGIKLTAIGLAIGTGMTVVLTKVLNSLLFGIDAFDPVTWTTVPALMVMISIAASSIPAWRASRINPIHGLRSE
ncbi:MAG TPA: ABC transporter permease [Pyrinomonadaceae bacterium]|jgi:putative ABC transport system permease protein